MKIPKITHIAIDEEISHKDREGFVPVCQYGKVHPLPMEIGGIFVDLEPVGLYGYKGRLIERIFLDEKVD